jgi:pimeloyl-ACP methyl ester carboxylesterase
LLGQAAFAKDAAIPKAMNAEASIPCPFAMPADEVEGETITCGQSEVPENWDTPDGPTLILTYAILHRESPAAFTDPVVYFSGGPGESTVSGLFALVEGFDAIRMNRDVILWDPRGTTHSGDMTCPADIQIPNPAAYDEAESNFPALVGRFDTHSDPDALYGALSEHFALSDYGRCVPYWEAQGTDISQYSTQNSNQDAIALLSHLGYPEYNLYGGSYGTTRVLGIADFYTNHPELDLPPIRSALIDGVFPRNIEWYEQSYLRARGVLNTFDLCEADAACAAAYPNIRQRAIDLLSAVEATPIVREDGSEITIDDLADVLLATPSDTPGLIPYLPRLVDELEQGGDRRL